MNTLHNRKSYQSMLVAAAICLAMAFAARPGWADKVVLGGAYNVFDDYLVVTTTTDPAQNCGNLLDAIAAVPGDGTIKLLPATYDCSESSVIVRSGITLEGSGQLTTKIIGQVDFFVVSEATVDLQSGAELNNLTVENTLTGGSQAVALLARCGSILNHVGAKSTGADSFINSGPFLADNGEEPCPTTPTKMHDVTIQVDSGDNNYGVYAQSNQAVSLDTLDIQSTGAGIIISANDALSIRNSVVDGDLVAIDSSSTNAAEIQHSQLIGGVSGSGTLKCFSVSDGNLAELQSNCAAPPE